MVAVAKEIPANANSHNNNNNNNNNNNSNKNTSKATTSGITEPLLHSSDEEDDDGNTDNRGYSTDRKGSRVTWPTSGSRVAVKVFDTKLKMTEELFYHEIQVLHRLRNATVTAKSMWLRI